MNKRHIWIMLLCCLLPIIGLAAIFIFNIPTNTVIYFGLILPCPIAHVFMMGDMHNRENTGNHEPAHLELEGRK